MLRTPMLAFGLLAAALGLACTSGTKEAPGGTSTSPEPPAAAAAEGFSLPNVTTPANALSPEGHAHFELFRIRRDFGKSDFEIALDAWTPVGEPSQIDDVRLWWFKSKKEGERGPFSDKTKRHFDIVYERENEGQWIVKLVANDGQEFTFNVEATAAGKVVAFATVKLDSGGTVERCNVSSGELRAKKLLGLTTGIKELAVTCTDGEGTVHQGKLAS